MKSKLGLLLKLIMNRNVRSIYEIIYFKIHKRKYEYVDVNREVDIISNDDCNNYNIAIYTCILGDYDILSKPIYKPNNVDYFIITDDVKKYKNTGWKTIDIREYCNEIDYIKMNRFIKLHPHYIFKDYKYSVYIDGNIQVIDKIVEICNTMNKKNKVLGLHYHNKRDCLYDEAEAIFHLSRFRSSYKLIEQQIHYYVQQNYPRHAGLYENTIIFREHNDFRCIKLMEEWWEQLISFSLRDQLSIPFILWKNDIKSENIFILGNDLKKSQYFKYYSHQK